MQWHAQQSLPGFFQIISPLGLPACEIGEASILRRHLRNGIKGFPRLVRHRRGSEGRIGWGCYNFGNSCSGRDRRTKKSTKPDNSPRLLFGNKGLHLAPEAARRRSSGRAPPAGTRTYTATSDFMTKNRIADYRPKFVTADGEIFRVTAPLRILFSPFARNSTCLPLSLIPIP